MLGLYAFCSDAAFKAALPALGRAAALLPGSGAPPNAPPTAPLYAPVWPSASPCPVFCAAALRLPAHLPAPLPAAGDRLLLHADCQSRAKFAARRCDSSGAAPRPAEIKLGKALAGLHCLEAAASVHIALPLSASAAATMHAAAAVAVGAETQRCRSALAAWDGALPPGCGARARGRGFGDAASACKGPLLSCRALAARGTHKG